MSSQQEGAERKISTDSFEFYKVTGTIRMQETGACAVHHWATIDSVKQLEELKDLGEAGLLTTDYHMNTPLHYAAACSSYNVAKMIVEKFPEYEFQNVRGITPAHIAAQSGDVKMLEILSQSKVLMGECSQNGWTPLHFAIYYERIDAVRFILENCDEKLKYMTTICSETVVNLFPSLDLRHMSPLDLAQHMKNKAIYDLLLEHKALPSLHCAIWNKDYRALSYYLFTKNEGVNTPAAFRNVTPLHLAAAWKSYEMCQCLLESGASVESLDCDGLSPLDIAVLMDSHECVQVIAARSTPKITTKALFLAADLNRARIGLTLMKKNMDPAVIDEKTGDTIIIRLIKRGFMGHAGYILENVPQNLQATDLSGATALHYACAGVRANTIINTLISKGASAANLDCDGITPFGYQIRAHADEPPPESTTAALEGLDAKRHIKEQSASPVAGDPDVVDKFGMTPAAYMILTNCMSSPVFPVTPAACARSFNVNVKVLLEQKPQIVPEMNLYNYTENKYETFSLRGVELFSKDYLGRIHSEWVDRFMEMNTDGMLKNCSLIHLVVLFGKNASVLNTVPLTMCPGLVDRPDAEGRTPLHLALLLRRPDMTEALINKQANLLAVDSHGNTVWHYIRDADAFNHVKTALLNTNLSLDARNSDGQTPLHVACKTGSVGVLRLLLAMVETPLLSEVDNAGKTAMDLALESGSHDCVKLLHSFGVENRLISAITSQDAETVQSLLDKGYPVNSTDKSGNTPLHIAALNGYTVIAKILIDHQADPTATTAVGLTPLHLAAQADCAELIRMLLATNFDVTQFRLENQPFQLCAKGSPNREFLYKYWKRQVVGFQYHEFVKSAHEALIMVERAIGAIQEPCKKNENALSLITAAKDIVSDLLFVSKKIIEKKYAAARSFNFMTSLHHLLGVAASVDMNPYFAAYKAKIQSVIDTIRLTDKSAKAAKARIILRFPIRWMYYIAQMIIRFKPHLLPEIDDLALYDCTVRRTEDIKNKAREILAMSDDVADLAKVTDPSALREIGESISVLMTATVTELALEPICIMRPQIIGDIQLFFGDKFFLPRSFELKVSQKVRMGLAGDFMFLAFKDHCVVIPMFFLHVQSQTHDAYNITSPNGTFKVTVPDGKISNFFFKVDLLFRKYVDDTLDMGQSLWQGEKDKLFKTIVSYRTTGMKAVSTRIMLIRANNETACYDSGYARVVESESAVPLFFNARTLEYEKGKASIVFCT